MADALADLEARVQDAKVARGWIVQAAALLASPADQVEFTCANPPYGGLFTLTLPRTVWGPPLTQQVVDAQKKVDAMTAVKLV